MPENIAISVDNVSKTFKLPHEKAGTIKNALIGFAKRKRGYEIQEVLDNVTFNVKEGEFFGIVGRNGSGKSTLLKMLAGIYEPTSGNIQVNGKLTPFIELGVGFNMELTGRENVYLNGALLGFSRKQMDEMYDDIVEFAELARFMDQKLKNYSSGMQVRLAFSIAIRANTPILLLDEVLAVGDEAFQRKCQDYFESLRRQSKTVIIVTHDMSAVEKFCTRGILIEAGKIIREGSAEVIAKAYSDMLSPTESSVSSSDEDANRFGDRRLEFSNVKTKVEDPEKIGSTINIEARINCTKDLDDRAVLAYALKDGVGQKLFGYNAQSKELNGIKKGESRIISFAFPNMLHKGKYYVDLSIYLLNEGVFTDCWIDCASFRVKTQGTEPYPIIVDTKFKEGKS